MKTLLAICLVLIVGLTTLVGSMAFAGESAQYDCWALGDYDQSWGVVRIGAPEAHAVNVTGNAVKLAIVDTGIDYTHPELRDIYQGGYDFVNSDSNPMDDHGHGTHCAGIAAAALGDLSGVAGVAPDVELYALKVLNAGGYGYWDDIVDGLDWAIANQMDVLSLSLGGPVSETHLEAAFQRAWDAGLVIVCSAGNDSGSPTSDKTGYPARYPTCIAVGATGPDENNTIAYFSSTGPATEVCAPGLDVYSSIPGGQYATMSGTSMACPHAAGTIALIESAHPDWTNVEVRGQLRSTATDLGPEGHDWQYGQGLINVPKAIGPLLPDVGMPDLPPPPTPPTLTTEEPTEVTETSAVFHGTLVDLGVGATYVKVGFRIDEIGADGWNRNVGTLYEPASFEYTETSLEPGTWYQVRAVGATDSGQFGNGPLVIFHTLGDAPPLPYPLPVTLAATEITTSSVRLNGRLETLGNYDEVALRFFMGYANTNVFYSVWNQEHVTEPGEFSAVITYAPFSPIVPNETYRFMFSVRAYDGAYYHDGKLTFTTPSEDPPPPPPPQYTLTTSVEGQGTVIGGGTYDEGEIVTVTAIPATGWQFDYWSGDLSGSQNPINITMDSNKSVTAHFSEILPPPPPPPPPPPTRELVVSQFTFEGGAKSGITIVTIEHEGVGEEGVYVQVLCWKNGKTEYVSGFTDSQGVVRLDFGLTPGTWDCKIVRVTKPLCTCEIPHTILHAEVTPK